MEGFEGFEGAAREGFEEFEGTKDWFEGTREGFEGTREGFEGAREGPIGVFLGGPQGAGGGAGDVCGLETASFPLNK